MGEIWLWIIEVIEEWKLLRIGLFRKKILSWNIWFIGSRNFKNFELKYKCYKLRIWFIGVRFGVSVIRF